MTSSTQAGLAELTIEGERGSLRFERRLSTDLADAWSAITQPERIARWFAQVTVQDQRWITYWDHGREYAEGQILRCEPQSLIEVSWRATDDADPTAESRLRITLTQERSEVLLRLEHEELLPADLTQYGPGWHAFLDQLTAAEQSADFSMRFDALRAQYEPLIAERL